MKLNLRRLESIAITLNAIQDIDVALRWYQEDLPGSAHIRVRESGYENFVDIQLERQELREVLEKRKQRLIQHLEERFEGFEYDPDADRSGD